MAILYPFNLAVILLLATLVLDAEAFSSLPIPTSSRGAVTTATTKSSRPASSSSLPLNLFRHSCSLQLPNTKYRTLLHAKKNNDQDSSSLMDTFVSTIVGQTKSERARIQLVTLLRVGLPSVLSGIAAFFAFPALALFLASIVNDAGVFAVLSQDSSQFVQNFLTVSGLLFSILIGQTYAFLYTQQEAVFYALFNEVTEAKSLLEQVALVCQGRSMYGRVLESICKYVQNDLKQLKADPAVLISARPIDDPLETIMYLTSVGVPSSVYETVRSLRQARAARLGALQRKLPKVHFVLLWILALIELVSFPLLGAGTQTLGGYNILTVEGLLFGIMTFGIVVTMRVIGELYRPGGGAYNVDGVLNIMIKGLELELKERMAGGRRQVANEMPSLPNDVYDGGNGSDLPMLTSGPSLGSNSYLKNVARKPIQFVKNFAQKS